MADIENLNALVTLLEARASTAEAALVLLESLANEYGRDMHQSGYVEEPYASFVEWMKEKARDGYDSVYLWHVSRSQRNYDEYDSFVVAARTEGEARRTHPDGELRWNVADKWYGQVHWGDNDWASGSWPIRPEDVTVKQIGIADGSIEPNTVLISSYNAG